MTEQLLSELRALLESDGHALTFQSVGQYRTSMLDFINAAQILSQGTTMSYQLQKLLQSINVRAVALAASEDPEAKRLTSHYSSFASELRAAMSEADTRAMTDPMDWPLPCDVTVGAGTHAAGTKLRGLVARMRVLDTIAARALVHVVTGVREFAYPIAPPAAGEPFNATADHAEPRAQDWQRAFETAAMACAADPAALQTLEYVTALATCLRNFKTQGAPAVGRQAAQPVMASELAS